MNRFETDFGDRGFGEGGQTKSGNLKAFSAQYAFQGDKWAIVVWARNHEEADYYCAMHGLSLDGEIVTVYKDE